jgi:hypothetical protein
MAPPSSASSPSPLAAPPLRPLHGRPQTSSVFFVGQLKQIHTTSLLLSPPSILSKMNSNLRILQDFIFQLNSDFISNSNLNPSRLFLRQDLSLGAPPPRLPMPISPQNQTLVATQVPPCLRCLSSLSPLIQSPPFKLNPVSVVRSQGPKHRRKNHIKSRYAASAIYHWSLAIVSRRGCNFFSELKVDPTSPVSSPWCTLPPRLYRSEIRGL